MGLVWECQQGQEGPRISPEGDIGARMSPVVAGCLSVRMYRTKALGILALRLHEARSETTGTFDDGTTVYGMSNLSRELDG